jgi:hypothetical protein
MIMCENMAGNAFKNRRLKVLQENRRLASPKEPAPPEFLGFFRASQPKKSDTVKSLGCNPGSSAFCQANHATQASKR